MKSIRVIAFLIVIISVVSCHKGKLEADIERMKSTAINLCLDSMIQVSSLADCNNVQTKYTYVVYVDSSQCFSCSNSKHYMWESFLRSYPDISLCMIYSSNEKIDKTLRTVTSKRYHWDVYLDTASVFERNNRHIPNSLLFHTFMINNSNHKVVIVGDPTMNEKLNSQMQNLINNF